MNMLMAEWKLEDALVVEREEGIEQGLEQGRTEGQNMVLELVRRGYSAEQIEARLAAGESSRTETAGK